MACALTHSFFTLLGAIAEHIAFDLDVMLHRTPAPAAVDPGAAQELDLLADVLLAFLGKLVELSRDLEGCLR